MRSAEFLFVIVSLVLLLGVLPANAVDIFLSDDEITVNGFPISEEENLVWLQRKVYTRPDLPDEMIAEPVDAVTITDKGIYHITGTLSNGQILVDAGNRDKIELILDGVNITCRTAPAIMIVKAKEADNPRDAAVRITLGEGSENFLYGSHLEKEIENPSSKHFSGTISSKRSLLISGNGHLVIEAEGEGIECKKHLTIESGNIEIRSGDDGINLDEEEISQFTMNGGSLSILCDRDIMGDAIDSNGMIEINGGSVFLSSTPNFTERGLDSFSGAHIHSGTVISAGNLRDNIFSSEPQPSIGLHFKSEPVDHFSINGVRYDFPYAYPYFTISSPEFRGVSDFTVETEAEDYSFEVILRQAPD